MTIRALCEYRKNYTRKGMLLVVRDRWKKLLFDPEGEYGIACGMTEGAFA